VVLGSAGAAALVVLIGTYFLFSALWSAELEEELQALRARQEPVLLTDLKLPDCPKVKLLRAEHILGVYDRSLLNGNL